MLPLPGSLSTAILPPCSSTIFETIARPRPTPSGLVVKNGLKMLSTILGIDAGAAVDHGDLGHAVRRARLHGDRAAGRRGLRRVQQQVVEDPLHQLGVEREARRIPARNSCRRVTS